MGAAGEASRPSPAPRLGLRPWGCRGGRRAHRPGPCPSLSPHPLPLALSTWPCRRTGVVRVGDRWTAVGLWPRGAPGTCCGPRAARVATAGKARLFSADGGRGAVDSASCRGLLNPAGQRTPKSDAGSPEEDSGSPARSRATGTCVPPRAWRSVRRVCFSFQRLAGSWLFRG